MPDLKKWLRLLCYPVSFRRRDWAVYRQLAENKNDITSADLLKIELGDAVLRDLKAEQAPHMAQPVHVLGIYKNPHMKYLHINFLFNSLLSMATVGFTRSTPRDKYSPKKMSAAVAEKDYHSIYLNRVFVFSPLGQLMFLSWFHQMATGAAAALTAGAHGILHMLGANPVTSALAASVGASSARPLAIRLLSLPVASFTDTLGHEHIHFLQKEDRDSGRTGFNAFAGALKKKSLQALQAEHKFADTFDKFASLGTVRYFLADHEVEARLHTLAAHGAKRWGRLPKTRAELWQALDDCGLPAPDGIRQEMNASPAGGFNAAAFTRKPGAGAGLSRLARRLFSPDVAELRIAQNTLRTPALKAEFWRETLPYLYGHLLELYGCKTGRADMGFSAAAPAAPAAPAPLTAGR